MLDKMKDMYGFQKQAKAIQKELKKTLFEAKSPTESVTVRVNGVQELVSITFGDDPKIFENPEKLSKEVVTVTNKAISKSQKASAERMRGVMGGLGLPGM